MGSFLLNDSDRYFRDDRSSNPSLSLAKESSVNPPQLEKFRDNSSSFAFLLKAFATLSSALSFSCLHLERLFQIMDRKKPLKIEMKEFQIR